MNRELIEKYSAGGKVLATAVQGLTDAQMRATPIHGKWSTHQVIIHLADAEAAFADRIRRVIAMENPQLLGWPENEFFKNLHYEKQSAADAVTLIDLTRRQLTGVLRFLPDEAFKRGGQHSERGPQSLEAIVSFAVSHLEHHLKFIAEKRAKLEQA